MLLTCRGLQDVSGVNSWRPAQGPLEFTEGDGPAIYIQLYDASVLTAREGFSPPGRRYVPAGTTNALQVTLTNLDSGKEVSRAATQPFSGDGSIWKLQLQPTDKIRGTVDMALELTETTGGDDTVIRGRAKAVLSIYPRS